MSDPSSTVKRITQLEDARYGSALLRLLSLAGWKIDVQAGRVRAVKDGVGEVTRPGTIADVAPDLFTAAVELQREHDRSATAFDQPPP